MKRQIAAGEFKAKCLALLDEVQQKREEIVVTKRGKPVARIVPLEDEKKKRDTFGYMKGTGIILGDIISPSGDIWDAER
ncbi:MAG TPA: type II toxin-antitoxin system prevent-host-death family antitoxin [Bryobacteraceae bacterium]|nr:type II toxin-antitoxin system prevent-host-death family antitoxin [Bryobacteraceae bacterium]